MRPLNIRPCSVDGCGALTGIKGAAKSLCSRHYNRLRRHGDPLKGARQPRPYGGVCVVDGCLREARVRGCCKTHSQRLYRNGDPHTYRRGRPWTAAEDQVLLDLPLWPRSRWVRSGYVADAAEHMDRTPTACRSRLHALRNARARAAVLSSG